MLKCEVRCQILRNQIALRKRVTCCWRKLLQKKSGDTGTAELCKIVQKKVMQLRVKKVELL